MTAPRFVCLCALAAFSGFAQVYQTPLIVAGPPAPKFELYADSANTAPNVTAGYANVRSPSQIYASGHRYFYDAGSHTYFGYDVVIEPGTEAGTYRATFYDISIGPLDFLSSPRTPIDPAQWKKLPLPAVPAPMVIHSGDTVSLDVFVDPDTHQKLTDSLSVTATVRDQRGRIAIPMRQAHPIVREAAPAPPPPIPAITGAAREFSVEDAVLQLREVRVTIDGQAPHYSEIEHSVTRPLVWFYAKDHGRYILSLAPRRELGFVEAGEVRGGAIAFTIGKDSVSLESPDTIAPDDAAYTLYVLHDPSWAPTAPNPAEFILLGSVSARELAALVAK